MALQHLRSSTANKRPLPAGMSDGQLAINTNLASPGLFFKDSNGDLVKVGPVHVGTTAPNASPAVGGQTGNTLGEQWLDTTGGTYVFKVWDGSAWRSESGTFVDVNGDVMTGALGIIAGTAGSPGLYISGDTNTGIYSPGADQLALSTNGTGRLFITDNRLRLNVASQFQITDSTSDSNGLQLTGSTSGDCLVGTLTNQSLVLRSNSTERLRISGGGRVQLPTTSQFQITDNADVTGLQFIGSSSAASTIGTMGAHALLFRTNSSERLRIDSSGRLLVGTSSARTVGSGSQATLQAETTSYVCFSGVNNTNDTGGCNLNLGKSRGTAAGSSTIVLNGDTLGTINFAGADGTDIVSVGARIEASVDGTPGANDMPGRLVFSTTADGAASPTERLRIDSSGRVGIGTTSPGAALDVSGNIRLSAGNPNIEFNNGGAMVYGPAGNTLAFATGGGPSAPSEKARIDSAGRFLVGTSSARGNYSAYGASLAQIEGANNDGARALSVTYGKADEGDPIIALGKHRSNSVGGTTIVANGDGLGQVVFSGSDGTNFVTAATIRAQVDGTPGANDMPGRLVFSTTADGASSPTERLRIDSSGRLLVGTSSARSGYYNGSAVTPSFQLESGGESGSAAAITNTSAGAQPPALLLTKTRSSAFGIVSDGDGVGRIGFQAADGTDLVEAARIEALIDGTPGANDMPGRLVFSTTADGASSPTERLRITSAGVLQVADAGNIQLGTTTGTKIGTATTQKLGFFNATPVTQRTAITNATTAGEAIAALNQLLQHMRDLGLIAT